MDIVRLGSTGLKVSRACLGTMTFGHQCDEPSSSAIPDRAAEVLAVLPYNPLAGGLLTGKYRGSKPPAEGGRFTLSGAGEMYRDRYWQEREHTTVAKLQGLAQEAGLSLTRLSVAWVLANPVMTSPIIGASRAQQLDEPLLAFATKLDADLEAQADEPTTEYRRGDAPR